MNIKFGNNSPRFSIQVMYCVCDFSYMLAECVLTFTSGKDYIIFKRKSFLKS